MAYLAVQWNGTAFSNGPVIFPRKIIDFEVIISSRPFFFEVVVSSRHYFVSARCDVFRMAWNDSPARQTRLDQADAGGIVLSANNGSRRLVSLSSSVSSLMALCVRALIETTWDFQVLRLPLPSNILNGLVFGWSWRWLKINHDFVTRTGMNASSGHDFMARTGIFVIRTEMNAYSGSCLLFEEFSRR